MNRLRARIESLETKAQSNVDNGNLMEAQQLYREALDTRSHSVSVLRRIAEGAEGSEDGEESLRRYQELLATQERLRGPEHHSLAPTLHKISLIQQLKHHRVSARANYLEAVRIAEKALRSSENLLEHYNVMGKQREVVKINSDSDNEANKLVTGINRVARSMDEIKRILNILNERKPMD